MEQLSINMTIQEAIDVLNTAPDKGKKLYIEVEGDQASAEEIIIYPNTGWAVIKN